MIYALVGGGLLLLFVGGELLVRGAVALAQRLRVSPLLIGLTVVAFGTSAPELVVSVDAALRGQPDIAVGNVVGSNIANILLILGAAALMRPLVCRRELMTRDGAAMLAASGLLVVLALTGAIVRWHGALMFAALIGYVVWCYRAERSGKSEELADRSVMGTGTGIVVVAVGLLALVGGARMLVEGAVGVARAAGISEAVIGLTLVAVGTSLPELATSVVAALRRQADVAVGNIIGSNLFNILCVLALTAIAAPVTVAASILAFDLWVMVGAAVLLLAALVTGRRISRSEGALLLAGYSVYVFVLYIGF